MEEGLGHLDHEMTIRSTNLTICAIYSMACNIEINISFVVVDFAGKQSRSWWMKRTLTDRLFGKKNWLP